MVFLFSLNDRKLNLESRKPEKDGWLLSFLAFWLLN